MSDTVTLRVQPFRSIEFTQLTTITIQLRNNDHLVFLLDYLYYNVYGVGCRWFFDHYLLRITRTLFRVTKSILSYCFLYLVIFLQFSGKPIFSYSSCSDILSCFLRYLSIRALSSFINSLYH